MYPLIRKLLFQLDPEQSHEIAMRSLQLCHQLKLTRFISKKIDSPKQVMGLTFQNPVGLAAGLDKNAEYIDALASLGFGFIEIGTVTPKPQAGNPHPRLFRLKKEEAIINRMGFNSKGLKYVSHQLEKTRYRGMLGINIGKNKETPNDHAIDDYLCCFRELWKFASYITINISSPNTPKLRELQQSDSLNALLAELKKEQAIIQKYEGKYVPLVVKISPDLSEGALNELAEILLRQKMDGVIATNTTISREGVEKNTYALEAGGLSGKPLQKRSTSTIKKLHSLLEDNIPIIASGGVMDHLSAQEKFHAGAKLLQVYTGFIYHGPALIRKLTNPSPSYLA